MAKGVLSTGLWGRAALMLAAAWGLMTGMTGASAQSYTFGPDAFRDSSRQFSPSMLGGKTPVSPSFSIPIEPLGFTAPGAIYLGQRNTLVSLDFLDENDLLFSFRVPGLIHRQFQAGESYEADERQIRAVVLSVSTGAVRAEALWTVHDRSRYLWMMRDGHFLLRDRNNLQVGDSSLALKSYLHFPGPVQWLELDPSQQLLVTNSHEPTPPEAKPGDAALASSASVSEEDRKPGNPPEMVVRVLRRDSAQVLLVSRVRSAVHLPVNADGYLEGLRSDGEDWLLNLNHFDGGSTVLGKVESSCSPTLDFVSQSEMLVSTCGAQGHKLVALGTNGHRLWEQVTPDSTIWPMVVMAPDGSRMVRESLLIDHAVNALSPIEREDVKGQMVEVLDAATGKRALVTPASPVLDGGGNVAISPSGRRVAVLNAGAIQVFELPAPPALADAAGNQPKR